MFTFLAFSLLFDRQNESTSSVFLFRWICLNFWVLLFPFPLWYVYSFLQSIIPPNGQIIPVKNYIGVSWEKNECVSKSKQLSFISPRLAFFMLLSLLSHDIIPKIISISFFGVPAASSSVSISFLQHFSIVSIKCYFMSLNEECLWMNFLSNLLGTCNFTHSGHVHKLLSLSFMTLSKRICSWFELVSYDTTWIVLFLWQWTFPNCLFNQTYPHFR